MQANKIEMTHLFLDKFYTSVLGGGIIAMPPSDQSQKFSSHKNEKPDIFCEPSHSSDARFSKNLKRWQISNRWNLAVILCFALFSRCASTAAPTMLPSAIPSDNCKSGWTVFESNKCYNFQAGDVTRDDCNTRCDGLQAQLPCVENLAQNEFIANNHPTTSSNIWLGMRDLGSANNYNWPSGCSSTYLHWASGQPDDATDDGSASQGEVYLNKTSNNEWFDTDGTPQVGCACESSHSASAPICPVGWTVSASGGCYYFENVASTRDTCFNTCAAQGAHMLCTDDTDEDQFVYGLRAGRRTWLGWSQQMATLSSDSGCPARVANWVTLGPTLDSNPHYVTMDPASNGQWTDADNTESNVYCACELKPNWMPWVGQMVATTAGYSLSGSFTTIGLSITVTLTSPGQKVFLSANIDVESFSASSAQFTIYRGSVDLGETILQGIDGDTETIRPVTMAYVDAPNYIGDITYVVQGSGAGDLSSYGQKRSFIAVVIPEYRVSDQLGSQAADAAITFAPATTYTSLNLDVVVKPDLDTDKVLLIFNGKMAPTATGAFGSFAFHKNGINMQQAVTQSGHMIVASKNGGATAARSIAMFLLDSPAAAATPISYGIRSRDISGINYDVLDKRQMAAIVLPASQIASIDYNNGATSKVVSSSTWTDLGPDGSNLFAVTITTRSTSDKVLILVTLNCMSSATGMVAITLMRADSTSVINLGDVSYGLHLLNAKVASENNVVSFTYLDTPNDATDLTYSVKASLVSGTSVSFEKQRSIQAILVSEQVGAPTSFPSGQPSRQPSRQPSSVPSTQPSSAPSNPSSQPSSQPSRQPSGRPSSQPTDKPSSQPMSAPSSQPSREPSRQPSSRPTNQPSGHPSSQPTTHPSVQPSGRPSRQPSTRPSCQPTSEPSSQPTSHPSCQPSSRPSRQPSAHPTCQPSAQPSNQPSRQPSTRPSCQPTSEPSSQPTSHPSCQPSSRPSRQPSAHPTCQPSAQPSNQPSRQPSTRPTCQPSAQPSNQPSRQPSTRPTCQPSRQPSNQPSAQPSHFPSAQPSNQPSRQPSAQPTVVPSAQPSCRPSRQPSSQPSCRPSAQPSGQPTRQPSSHPTMQPSGFPTSQPASRPSAQPSSEPSRQPSTQPTSQPSGKPTQQPVMSPTSHPSSRPSSQPSTEPSRQPTTRPTSQPLSQPSAQPSCRPTRQPSSQPSSQPFGRPTNQPSSAPSTQPTRRPTSSPSRQPSSQPTNHPSSRPTAQPSRRPSSQPTSRPSTQPSSQPSRAPTSRPSAQPSRRPTSQPSAGPSAQPSGFPTSQPAAQPSAQPSSSPTSVPSNRPSVQPSARPSTQPAASPTSQPSHRPTSQPVASPSSQPSGVPTRQPSSRPSARPTSRPTSQPSARPSSEPSSEPTRQPSASPSDQPTCSPSSHPSSMPSTAPTSDPSCQPTASPSSLPSARPSAQPSGLPSVCPTSHPSVQPTSRPSAHPSSLPSSSPTSVPSARPSVGPSSQPSARPSGIPSSHPSSGPTTVPSAQPSGTPSSAPSSAPSGQPTGSPSSAPTALPSAQPSVIPSVHPSGRPTSVPSGVPSSLPSASPSALPSAAPTSVPSGVPSVIPSSQPSGAPSGRPTSSPTTVPSSMPSSEPSSSPTAEPSSVPSSCPTTTPSSVPSASPTASPTSTPSARPSAQPSVHPSGRPSGEPSSQPAARPSAVPSSQPRGVPSAQPSSKPFAFPTSRPSAQPTVSPTSQPRSHPTSVPTSQPRADPTSQPSAQPYGRPTSQPSGQPSQAPVIDPANHQIIPAPNITSIDVYSNKSYIDVKVTLKGRDEALVYCAVFPLTSTQSGYALTSVMEIVLQNRLAYTTGRVASLTISGLSPVSKYSIYCMTQAMDSTRMSYAVALRNQVVTQTLCCKMIYVELLVSNLYETKSAQSAIAVTFDSPPSKSIALSVAFAATTSPAPVAVTTAYPSQLSFSSTSSGIKPAYFTIIAGDEGIYQLIATVSGLSAAEYKVQLKGRITLNVLDLQTEPPTPVLRAAQFSNDGSTVVLTFDSPTDKGGVSNKFPCVKFLTFPGANQASCEWTDTSKVAIYPLYTEKTKDNVLQRASQISLKTDSPVRAFCNRVNTTSCKSWASVSAQSVSVSTPDAPTAPAVSISGPASIGGCNSLTLDLANSAGAAGRPWSSVEFSVLTTPDVDEASRKLLKFLTLNYTMSPPTPIPNDQFQKGLTYAIQAKLCNFLGACGTAVKSVFVSASEALVPVASILGKQKRTMRKMDPLLLNSNSFTQSCTGAISYNNLQTMWRISRVTSSGEYVLNTQLKSASQNPTVYKLDPYALTVGANYEIVLDVTSLVSSKNSVASVLVEVVASAVVSKIAGGSPKSFQTTDKFTLDASSSYDEDVFSLTGAAAGLSFSWSCVQTAPSFSAVCPLVLPATLTTEKLAVTTTSSAADTASRVTVVVSSGTRTSTSFVDIQISATPTPQLGISSSLATLSNVNINQNLPLMGSLKLVTACTAKWTVDDDSIDLEQVALTTPSRALQVDAKPILFNLVVGSGKLPERASLTFTLSCGDAKISTIVTTNGAPLPGQFSVTPPEGTELSTPFNFAALQWSDPDIPIKYMFGFESVTSLSNLVIVSKSEFSYASSTLPAGVEALGNKLNCTLQVFDILGAFTSMQTSVVVTKASVAEQRNSVLELIKSSSGSVDDVKRVLSVASTVINSVNCTGAPNCTALNRQGCLTTSQSCGACATGYIGDSGDQNTMCVPTFSVNATAAVVACSSNLDCNSWQFCDRSTQSCSLLPKSCFGNCSNNGECLYSSASLGVRVDASNCKLDNLGCSATCSCVRGFSGRYCEITNEDLKSRRAVRSQLVDSLLNLTVVDDINRQSMESWSASLYALSLNPYELSVNDAANIVAIANKTINYALLLGVDSFDDIKGVLQATDTVSSVRKSNYNPNDYKSEAFNTSFEFQNNTATGIIQTVSLFSDLAVNSMVLGQDAVSYFYDNFRLSSELVAFSSNNGNITITAPQTQFEALQNTPMSTVDLVPAIGDGTATTSALKVKVITVYPRAYSPDTTSFESDPIYLQISSDTGEAPGKILSNMVFTFKHNSDTSARRRRRAAAANEIVNMTSTCRGLGMNEHYTHICPDSGIEIFHNCSGRIGNLTSSCPVWEPTCARLNVVSAELEPSTGCEVVSSDDITTVCNCAFTSSERRRKLEAVTDFMEQSGVSNMIATSAYVATGFVDTFDAAESFSSPDAFAQVLIVIYLFATLWGSGFLILSVCCVKHNPRVQRAMRKMVTRKVLIDSPRDMENIADAKQCFLNYIDNIIPLVYADQKSHFSRVIAEISSHHRYVTLFTLGDGKISTFNKVVILLKVLTIDTMQMFLLAVLYDLQSPDDDGTCTTKYTEDSCLSRRSITDDTQNYCQWKYEDSQHGFACSYAPPTTSMKTFIYILIFISIVVSFFNIPLDYLFKVCSAPLLSDAEAVKVSKATVHSRVSMSVSKVVRNARRLSVAAGQAAGKATAAISNIAPRNSMLGSLFRKPDTEAVIANREISEDLQRVHSTVVTLLPRVTIQAQVMQRNKQDLAKLMKCYADSKRTAFSRSAVLVTKSDMVDMEQREDASDTTDCDKLSVGGKSPLSQLCDEVIAQRMLLADGSDMAEEFDAQWGIERIVTDPSVNPRGEFMVSVQAREAIKADIYESEDAAAELKGTLSNYTLHHAGLAVLNMFMHDVLGRRTAAAKIFENKFEEDFAQTQAVSTLKKVLAFAVIIGANAFFIYFTLLKAFQKGQTWQYSYLFACIAQMVTEIFLNETLECLWLNYMVPNLVVKEVQRAAVLLKKVAGELTGEMRATNMKDRLFLNAPSYLFSSTKVATDNPKLLESVVVLSYQTHLPGELCKTWPHYKERMKIKAERFEHELSTLMWWKKMLTRLALSLSTTIVLMMQWLGTFQFSYQRVIIRFIQPLLMSALTLLCLFAASSTLALYVLIIFGATVIGSLVVQQYVSYRKGLAEAAAAVAEAVVTSDNECEIDLDIQQFKKKMDAADKSSSSSSSSSGSSESSKYSAGANSNIVVRYPAKKALIADKRLPGAGSSESGLSMDSSRESKQTAATAASARPPSRARPTAPAYFTVVDKADYQVDDRNQLANIIPFSKAPAGESEVDAEFAKSSIAKTRRLCSNTSSMSSLAYPSPCYSDESTEGEGAEGEHTTLDKLGNLPSPSSFKTVTRPLDTARSEISSIDLSMQDFTLLTDSALNTARKSNEPPVGGSNRSSRRGSSSSSHRTSSGSSGSGSTYEMPSPASSVADKAEYKPAEPPLTEELLKRSMSAGEQSAGETVVGIVTARGDDCQSSSDDTFDFPSPEWSEDEDEDEQEDVPLHMPPPVATPKPLKMTMPRLRIPGSKASDSVQSSLTGDHSVSDESDSNSSAWSSQHK